MQVVCIEFKICIKVEDILYLKYYGWLHRHSVCIRNDVTVVPSSTLPATIPCHHAGGWDYGVVVFSSNGTPQTCEMK